MSSLPDVSNQRVLRSSSKIGQDVARAQKKTCKDPEPVKPASTITGTWRSAVAATKAPISLKLGHSLKKIADILECEAKMKESDNEAFLRNLERSRSLYEKKPETENHLRGSDAIRRIAKECGAKHPETLSSTKHISTLSTVLNLKDNEMDILANFLGHDIHVHRQYYRLPEGTLQLAKVSKVLLVLEQGRLSDFKGMSLDQM
ncbi:Flotillin-like protein 6, partial [Dissostichus eleginoides]